MSKRIKTLDSWVTKGNKDKKTDEELHQPGACDGSSESRSEDSVRKRTLLITLESSVLNGADSD